jgi:hypothetical protein
MAVERRTALILTSLLFVLALTIACPALAHAGLRVEWTDGLITITADTVPRETVLEAIGREAGVEVVGLDAMPQETVTLRFTRVPLLDAVRRLVGDVSAVLTEERAPDGGLRLVSVRVFAHSPPRQEAGEEVGDTGHAETVARAEPERDTVVREFEGNPLAAREFARKHPDPRVRRVAITYLGEQATAGALEVLFSLLEDRESSVRQSALEALGPLVKGHRRVRETLVGILERSEDNDTRQLIADSIGVSLDTIEAGQPIALTVLDDAVN